MERSFTPATGRFGMSRLYDPVLKLGGESRWRRLTLDQLAPRQDDIILDVGCGTGTLALLLARHEAQPRVIGVDPDPSILSLAQAKARRRGVTRVEWCQGMGDRLTEVLGTSCATKVTSSLVLHQCPLPMKQAMLASMYAALQPGGRLVITDFGLQRTALMRLAFRLIQFTDGKEDTQPNADGILPELMRQAGFVDISEAAVVNTLMGSISVYVAARPASLVDTRSGAMQ